MIENTTPPPPGQKHSRKCLCKQCCDTRWKQEYNPLPPPPPMTVGEVATKAYNNVVAKPLAVGFGFIIVVIIGFLAVLLLLGLAAFIVG